MATGALETQGVILNIGDGGGPEVFEAIGEVTDFDGPGGSANVIDATHLGSTFREKLMGIPDEGQFTFSLNLVPGDNGQRRLVENRANRTLTNFQLMLTDTPQTTLAFSAYVLSFSQSGAVDDKINASVTLEITGQVTGFPAPV